MLLTIPRKYISLVPNHPWLYYKATYYYLSPPNAPERTIKELGRKLGTVKATKILNLVGWLSLNESQLGIDLSHAKRWRSSFEKMQVEGQTIVRLQLKQDLPDFGDLILSPDFRKRKKDWEKKS